jgi:hypothetical protein
MESTTANDSVNLLLLFVLDTLNGSLIFDSNRLGSQDYLHILKEFDTNIMSVKLTVKSIDHLFIRFQCVNQIRLSFIWINGVVICIQD